MSIKKYRPARKPGNVPVETLPLEKRPMSMQAVVDAIQSPDITYPKLQRAVRAGLIRHFTLQNNRKLVRICDVFAAMGVEGGNDE